MDLERIILEVDRYVRGVQKIVGEILLDHISLVAEAYDEIIDAPVTVNLHDVPQNRLAADLDHRLGNVCGFLADSSAVATCENHSFHEIASLITLPELRPSRRVPAGKSSICSRVH